MGGKKSDNNDVERVVVMNGMVDIEFDPQSGKAYLGVTDDLSKMYNRVEFGGVQWIEDLMGALQRLKNKVAKAEQ
ncbi:hypothetical protein A3B35_03680 [Candidatus Kaiserbacteria bacterium RIFCSPLOWO2_01_FULL_54_24]|uniref:Uncharacterized protein n=1 Tax=Candidatus Kaiserbacteria bacterium RIFCSPLOWO2_01_FULL_54_24 TaxID=1798515 RepID=A0A1F6EVR6_9BACT|nr:MAG: hypothetical protein A3B35_03680 [Candidatus Kaiserbacteria bacterium RIFCSPLOWO2_01_FULL_54_24]